MSWAFLAIIVIVRIEVEALRLFGDSVKMTVPKEYKDISGLRTLANYLRVLMESKQSVTQHEKRVDYFRGYRFIESVVEDDKPLQKWPTLQRLQIRESQERLRSS